MRKSQVIPELYRENTVIPITKDLEMLGVTVDNKMKFEKHIAKVNLVPRVFSKSQGKGRGNEVEQMYVE